MTFVRVAAVDELSDPGQQLVEVDDRLVVLFRVNGEFFAIDDVCTHDGGPLSDGVLCDHEIACPRHGAKFDIRTGRALTMPATKPTLAHDVRIEGNSVLVQLREASDTPPQSAKIISSSLPETKTLPTVEHAAKDCVAPPLQPSTAIAAKGSATGGLSEERCREELKSVIDPELFVNIVDLGLIYLVQVTPKEDGHSDVVVEMTMTSPACPAGPQLLQNSKDALKRIEGVDLVEVKLVMTPPWTPDRMTDDARDKLGIF